MPDDIVEWLRNSSSDEWCSGQLLKAAAEITRLRAENEKLREAVAKSWEPFELIAKSYGPYDPKNRDLSDFVDGYVQACDDIAKAIRNYQIILNSSSAASNSQVILDSSERAAAAAIRDGGRE